MNKKEWLELLKRDKFDFEIKDFEKILKVIKKYSKDKEKMVKELDKFEEFEVGFVFGYIFAVLSGD